jgi:hypothetical protein
MTRNASHAAPADAQDAESYRAMLQPETRKALEERERLQLEAHELKTVQGKVGRKKAL